MDKIVLAEQKCLDIFTRGSLSESYLFSNDYRFVQIQIEYIPSKSHIPNFPSTTAAPPHMVRNISSAIFKKVF